ncbi:hypothetical protein JAB6_46460 [Janthinobacterium sp. HH104]|uniref:hypothetical protein n=1 Tax=unclassified Janthinobacterium TaxID=2610881 RepID=UPI0008933A97|nr:MULTISPECIES: hypothetical protein [unclassified Janthinobacterium]OEZ80301.1 hypothetical protein JAB6_46460 [Janthinobacterium sp. HH104]
MTAERSLPAVAALFVRANSIYKTMPAVDAWDAERDARAWPGGVPVVAHPPCRSWGTLRHLAKPRPDEKELAVWAVAQVRKFGGVLEHPKRSTLWPHCNLPAIGERDKFGGWTLPIFQSSFGHRAEKATLLYIVGCAPAQIPAMPIVLGDASHVIAPSGRNRAGERRRKGDPGWRPECGKAEREHTPPELAHWLVSLARRCMVPA